MRHTVATVARGFAAARVRPGHGKGHRGLSLRGEVDQEEAVLWVRTELEYDEQVLHDQTQDLVYDGNSIQATLSELLPDPGANPNIVATGRKLASWDEAQQTWVSKSVIEGNPILVSMTSEGAPTDAAVVVSEVRKLLA